MLTVPPEIHCLAQTADVCGEGVLFHAAENAVYWTDINRALIHRLDLATEALQTWQFDQPVTSLLLSTDLSRLVVVLGGRGIVWEPLRDTREAVLFELPGWPEVRCNDAGIDPDGKLWIGTMQNNVAADGTTKEVDEALGELLLLDGQQLLVKQSHVLIANTVVWSPDGSRLYFADTLRNEILSFAYDGVRRSLSERRVFASGNPRGLPDGSAMDAEGYLWNCRYGGGCVLRFAPDGRLDRVVDMPVPNPTSCAFGGADGRTLFVTSAGEGVQKAGPDDGGLFCFDAAVAGAPRQRFRL